MTEKPRRLADVHADIIKPFNQTEAKAAVSALKEMGGEEPVIAAMLAEGGPLKDFLVASLSLSPYLKDIAVLRPGLLAAALAEPLDALLAACLERARLCWAAPKDGALPSEADVMTALRAAKREVSFYLAFRVALRAHNVSGVDRSRIYKAIRQRFWRRPLSFFWP